MSDNSTNENIKNGAGLAPIQPSTTSTISGITTEQRGQNTSSGIRTDRFSEQEAKKEK